jgi:uncharacterized protein with FMN-binding domain
MKKYVISGVIVIAFIFYSFLALMNYNSTSQRCVLSVSDLSSGINNINTNSNVTVNPVNSIKDGLYTGDVADAFYGNIQVAAVIQNGKLVKVNILQYPNDRQRSIEINSQALPILQSEAIRVQSATVDIVSGATDTSQAFITSLGSALFKAGI